MESSLHGNDFFISEIAIYQFPGMTFNCGNREMRNILVIYLNRILNSGGESAEPGTEDDTCVRFVYSL